MSCTSLDSQLTVVPVSTPVAAQSWKKQSSPRLQFVPYLSSQPHLGYNERVMSTPHFYSLSSPTATCPARIYSSPGDAESLAVPSATAEKEKLTQAAALAGHNPCCYAAWSQKAFASIFPGLSPALAPETGGRATKGNSDTHSLNHVCATLSLAKTRQRTLPHAP